MGSGRRATAGRAAAASDDEARSAHAGRCRAGGEEAAGAARPGGGRWQDGAGGDLTRNCGAAGLGSQSAARHGARQKRRRLTGSAGVASAGPDGRGSRACRDSARQVGSPGCGARCAPSCAQLCAPGCDPTCGVRIFRVNKAVPCRYR